MDDQAEAIGSALDYASAALGALVLVTVAIDVRTPVRAIGALVFVLFAPGWALVRTFSAPATPLVMAGAVALSISVTLLVGQGLVLWGQWQWFTGTMVLTALTILAGAVNIVRFRRQPA